MRFMLIVKANKDSEAGVPPDPKLMAAIHKSGEDMVRDGTMISNGRLTPSSMGARLRLAGGKVTVTDGPFTEAKEIIGGYAIVEVKSKEEAVEMFKNFWLLHAEFMGPSYVGEGEVREMFGASDDAP
jgi:hypothetical protein